MKNIYLIVFLGGLLQAQPAYAVTDGNELLNWCKRDSGSYSTCLAYVAGAIEMRQEWSLECPVPNGLKWGQSVAIIEKYMSDFPERRHLPATTLIHDALARAYPCKKQ
jgi:hypothetical protein